LLALAKLSPTQQTRPAASARARGDAVLADGRESISRPAGRPWPGFGCLAPEARRPLIDGRPLGGFCWPTGCRSGRFWRSMG